MNWIIAHKVMLQWLLFGTLTFATGLQLLLNMANQRQSDLVHSQIQQSLNGVSRRLEQLSKVEGLERYLQDIKIESLRKYVDKKDLEELENYLEDFSQDLNAKDVEGLRQIVKKILAIVPTDPFFRVYNSLLETKLIQEVFSGKLGIVQIVRWDWKVQGDERASLYVSTAGENGESVTQGPFTDNTISMLDLPLRQFIQIRVESTGTGIFEWYPRSFRIGWAVAEKQRDGSWRPLLGLAEYDPYFRISINGQLEF